MAIIACALLSTKEQAPSQRKQNPPRQEECQHARCRRAKEKRGEGLRPGKKREVRESETEARKRER
jgi:hypothetical protein